MVVGLLGSSGSQGRASNSSSFSPEDTNFGGCEWLSMALILLISASNWGSAVCARSVEARKMKARVTVVFLTMEVLSSELARARVNPSAPHCKSVLSTARQSCNKKKHL